MKAPTKAEAQKAHHQTKPLVLTTQGLEQQRKQHRKLQSWLKLHPARLARVQAGSATTLMRCVFLCSCSDGGVVYDCGRETIFAVARAFVHAAFVLIYLEFWNACGVQEFCDEMSRMPSLAARARFRPRPGLGLDVFKSTFLTMARGRVGFSPVPSTLLFGCVSVPFRRAHYMHF